MFGERPGSIPNQNPAPPLIKLFLNLHFLAYQSGVVHVEASEGVVENILGVGIGQLLSHEGEEGSEVDLSGTHFDHFSTEFVVLHDS